ncbi:hypothetical protein [uncultured Hyphomicrobium sp.]|uniref:hypothetical protein n=1 Tax=uncultured Hyphomicrobium sp. TaxID=194373 RepID=UPI0025EAB2C6|nr:hypothetical protein [uncultured Hyphomicrobium sp.]
MLKVCIGCLAALSLSACAGRTPQPTPLVMISDRQLDCSAIEAEIKLNNQKISDLAIEKGWKMGQNAVAGVVGFMIWPAWLGMDLQNAAGQEATALSQRNQYLLALAREKCQPKSQTASLTSMPAPPPFETTLSPLASNSEITSSLTLVNQ